MMKPQFKPSTIMIATLFAATSLSTLSASAQPSQLGAPSTTKPPSTLAAPLEPVERAPRPLSPFSPLKSADKPPPIRIPGKANVDLAITNYGERASNVYYVSVKNIGTTASAETNVYCAANASTPNGGAYALERVYMMKPLAPNAAYVTTCDFRASKGAFNSSQGALKPGEKIFDVHFIVNNQKQIVETNYENNDVHAKPGIAQNPVKPPKD